MGATKRSPVARSSTGARSRVTSRSTAGSCKAGGLMGSRIRVLVCTGLLFCALVTLCAAQAATARGGGGGGGGSNGEPLTDEPQGWALRASGYLYLTEDGDFLQPTIAAEHHWLHLEARYNYEERKTVSTWMGYNFSVGKTVTLDITPILGGVIGDTDGIGLGYEGTLTWRWVELYSESEYVFT